MGSWQVKISFLIFSFNICFSQGICPSILPSSTVHVHKVFGNKCLEFVLQDGGQDWDSAEANCRSKRGHLVTIESLTEQNFILSTLKSLNYIGKGVWIGLTDFGHESSFTWSSRKPLTYAHWGVGQPGNGHDYEDCVLLKYPSGYWSDELCREFVFFGEYDEWICEYESHDSITKPLPQTTPSHLSVATVSTTAVPCPPFNCGLDCGLQGYEYDKSGCALCLCAKLPGTYIK